MSNIQGSTVLVTGAAAGMGKLMAERFAREGAQLVLVDVNEAALDELAGRLRAGGATVHAFACDLSKHTNITDLHRRVTERDLHVDLLVNNAGVVTGGVYDQIPDGKDRLMLDVNVGAVHWMTKAFLPGMKKRRRGHVVNLASAAGFLGVPDQVVYCASKWFVIGFSEALRLELTQQGFGEIQVTIVCPSFVDTGMFTGVKAPFLTPLLKPDFVVGRIFEAVANDTLYVREPFIVKTTPLLRALLPRRLFDSLTDRLGVTRSMHSWTGH